MSDFFTLMASVFIGNAIYDVGYHWLTGRKRK